MVKNSGLLKRLNRLGLTMLENEEELDANAALADLVKTRDLRLWENFPVVLANSSQNDLFNYAVVRQHLKEPSLKANFDSLTLVSLALYESLNLKFSWADKLRKMLGGSSRGYKDALEKFKKGENLKVGGFTMSGQKLKENFSNYFQYRESKLNDLLSAKEELGLEYALSQVFPPKQKELFLKKLKREKLTKTEKEYFSRVVRKRALALANPELHRLAQRLLES